MHIQHTSRHGAVDHIQNTGFGRNTGHADVFAARAKRGLQDRIAAMRHRFHLNHRQRGFGFTGLAREFRHRFAGVGVLIFTDTHVRQQFAFNHDFGVGNGFFVDGNTVRQFHRFPA